MAITAMLVSELRAATGVGMMDCKKALVENDGDFDKAVDWLRARGIAKAAKKEGRISAEGLISLVNDGNKAAITEVNSETDFLAQNPEFIVMAGNTATAAMNVGADVNAILDAAVDGTSIHTQIETIAVKVGEKVQLRKAEIKSVETGIISSYIHGKVSDKSGRIGVLVVLETSTVDDSVTHLGTRLAMHVAAAKPIALAREDLSPETLEREANVLREKATASGKPADVIEKIVVSGLNSFAKEKCLLSQAFVHDTSKTVEQVIAEVAKQSGSAIKLTSFTRLEPGEGIEKKVDNFVADVAAQAGIK